MAVPITVTKETAYATKDNIIFPGSDAQRDAAETAAEARINERLGGDVVAEVYPGAIPIDGEPIVVASAPE